MKKSLTPRVMISAAGSSSGKTTVVMALVSALVKQNRVVQCMKTGPDYIDPMFHEYASGRKSYHADAFFSDTDMLRNITGSVCEDADICLTEGAMGFYDGTGKTSECSAYTVASRTSTPVILVVSPQGMGISVAALIKGYKDFRENSMIRGVILNRIKPAMYSYYREIIERETGLSVAGFLPEMKNTELKSRHLGLVTAEETENISAIIEELGNTALETIDFKVLDAIASEAEKFEYTSFFRNEEKKFRIGVALDRAFCFYYHENLRMLEGEGAELVFFSPLEDKDVPENLDGIYLGGGYPEEYLQKLSENHDFIRSFSDTVKTGIPLFAECGGFMYLLEGITGRNGDYYKMTGILEGNAEMRDRLVRFGYITLESSCDNVFCRKGTVIKAHEFHYSDSTSNGSGFRAAKPGGREWEAIVCRDNITAGYPHMYFPSSPEAVTEFCGSCLRFKKEKVNTLE